jgi:hypothetical protein
LTDPNNSFSEVKYRFDIGANVWAKSPTIDGNATNSGKETVREFDTIGRPTKETLINTGAYSRYEYPQNGVQSKVYSTITDVNNNGADSADEVLSESWADGTAMFDEGTDDSPVELDGLGGNAGISTPYLPFGGNPPQQYPEYQQMNDESVMRINGQDVRATLDGVGIPFAFALHLLQNGSALPAALAPFQHLQGFRFESNGLGTFSVNIPRQVGWNVTYNGANDARGTANPVYLGSNNYTFSFGDALKSILDRIRKARDEGPLTTTSGPITDKINLRPLTCIFNINLKVPKELEGTDIITTVHDDLLGDSEEIGFLRQLKNSMRKYFENAGQFLTFNNPEAASRTKNGNYNLSFQPKFTGIHSLGVKITTFFSGTQIDNVLGVSIGNTGQIITTSGLQNARSLANVGVHEDGHHVLGGHSEGNNVMNAAYNDNHYGFSAEQARKLSDLCNKK